MNTITKPKELPIGIKPSEHAPLTPIMIEEETIGFYMTRTVITVSPHDRIVDALRLMMQYRIGCLPVVEGSALLGVITDQLLIKCMAVMLDHEIPLQNILEKAATIQPQESIHTAFDRIRGENVRYLLVVSPQQELAGLISQTDILEASRSQLLREQTKLAEATKIAEVDSLTGLFTRHIFDQALETEFVKIRQYGGNMSLLLLDIDDFKKINDLYGHSAGDEALLKVGKLIQKHVRHADIPVRYGGDEFLVLLPDCGLRKAYILGELIRREIEKAVFVVNGSIYSLTLSGGVSKWLPSHTHAKQIFQEADQRLYQAKKQGKNRIEGFAASYLDTNDGKEEKAE